VVRPLLRITLELIMTDKDPNERLTSRQVAEEFNIPNGTLGYWRFKKQYDGRLPRFHKYITGKVFYVRSEITEDLAKMEVETGKLEMVL